MAYIISFEKNVLICVKQLRLEKWTDPGNKGFGLIMKKLDFSIPLLMNIHWQLYFQIMGLFINKVLYFFLLIFAESILNVFLYFYIKIKWKTVLFIDLIKNLNTILKFGVLIIKVRKNGSKRSVDKGESNDTNNHNNRTKYPFLHVVSNNISIPYCCDCSTSPIQTSCIQF